MENNNINNFNNGSDLNSENKASYVNTSSSPKKKLLIPILASATGVLGATTVGLGVAYGLNIVPAQKMHIEAGNIDEKIIGNNMATYFTFTLRDKLSDGEKLTYTHDDGGKFTFSDIEVKNRSVTIPIYWLNTDIYDSRVWEGKIIFTCTDINGQILWTQTIEGARCTYEPYCMLDPSTKELLMDLDPSDTEEKTVIVTCKFNVPTGVKTYGNLVAKFDTSKYPDNKFIINESSASFSYEESDTERQHPILTFKAIKDATDIAECDSFKFDVQVSCLYEDTDIPIWISNTFKAIEASYFAAPKILTEDFLVLQSTPEGAPYYGMPRLAGIKNKGQAESEHYNTLVIPKDVIVVGNGDGTAIDLPSTVTKIVMAKDSVLTYFEEKAFYNNSQVKFIDVSNISDKALGLETISYGSNAFGGWSDTGKVIWGSNFSFYKRHMLTAGLYSAGLTSPKWYNITEVSDESQLREACNQGANIKLVGDVTIHNGTGTDNDPFTYLGQIEIKNSLVLDLNGYTITSTGPIYNHSEKQFAIFGIWDGVEVVMTDSYEGNDTSRPDTPAHGGSVKAYNYLTRGGTEAESAKNDLAWQPIPEVPVGADPKDYENEFWAYCEDALEGNKWKPREQRCFYIRTDTPSKEARTSLDILAGKYYGNCTTIMNWNGACWIEETFASETHEYAPEFHIYSSYFVTPQQPVTDPVGEIINCDDGYCATKDAYFEIYGGKFFAKPGIDTDGEYTNDWYYYPPTEAPHDFTDKARTKHANWLANEEYRDLFEVITNEQDHYNIVVRKA